MSDEPASDEVEIPVIRYEVARLRLKPGDVVLIRVPTNAGEFSSDSWARYTRRVKASFQEVLKLAGHDNPVVVMDARAEFCVIEAVSQIDASSPPRSEASSDSSPGA